MSFKNSFESLLPCYANTVLAVAQTTTAELDEESTRADKPRERRWAACTLYSSSSLEARRKYAVELRTMHDSFYFLVSPGATAAQFRERRHRLMK